MPRIREISMDGVTLKIAPFSFDEMKKYMETNKKMVEDKAADEEWSKRAFATVVASLNKAAGSDEWNTEKLAAEYDLPFITYLHEQILEFSGLKQRAPGGVPATSTGS